MPATPDAYAFLRTYFDAHLMLTEPQFAAIRAIFEPRTLRKHELLVRAGAVARVGAFVVQGCLRSYVIDPKGKEHIIQFAPEQWWISDQNSISRQEPAMFYIDAVEDSEVLLFDTSFYRKLSQLTPEFSAFFTELLRNSMRAMQKRLVLVLSASAEERYLDFVHTYPTLALRLPQKMIAAYLGVTPESLSRIRRELIPSSTPKE
jgi:CRP-like cAMP-binding protein